MFEALSIYYGSTQAQYPRTWRYRTIIAAHREQYSEQMYRKGYGKDWQEDIKPDVLEYTRKGRLPLASLRHAAELIRQVETLTWALRRAEQSTPAVSFKPPIHIAFNK